MKGIKITVMVLVFCQAAIAQNKTAEEITARHVDRLDTKVELTAEQKSSIETVVLKSTKEIQALREKDGYTPEERKAIKKAERSKINEILTASQKQKLKDARGTAEDRKQLRTQKQEKRQKRAALKSELQEKRAIFNNVLTDSEKQIIEKARSIQPAKLKGKAARASLSDQEKEARKSQMRHVFTSPKSSKFDVTVTLKTGRKFNYTVQSFSYDPMR